MALIECEKLSKVYDVGNDTVHALRDGDVILVEGDFTHPGDHEDRNGGELG